MPFEFKLSVTVSAIPTEEEARDLSGRVFDLLHQTIVDSPDLPPVVADNHLVALVHRVEYTDTPPGDDPLADTPMESITRVLYPFGLLPGELRDQNDSDSDAMRRAAARHKEMTASGELTVIPDPELAECLRNGIDQARRGETHDRGSFAHHLDDKEE